MTKTSAALAAAVTIALAPAISRAQNPPVAPSPPQGQRPAQAPSQAPSPTPAQDSAAEVSVTAVAPVPGAGIESDRLPYSVFTSRASDIESAQAASLPELLTGRLPSVQMIETQGNPFQPELSFRGFGASPLLGAPQGLSVFLDGMRLNEPFGDVVNFDLIPLNAIDRVTLVGGSQPAFGLNTLGGALSLTTKNGRTLRDGEIDLTVGSHGRRSIEFEQGGVSANGRHDWYIAANRLRDGGWRRFSPSDLKQVFAKWGVQSGAGRFELQAGLGDSRLAGNGLLPASFFALDRRGAYSRPDVTNNRGAFVQALATRPWADDGELTARLSVRRVRTTAINGDVAEVEAEDRLGLEPYSELFEDCVEDGLGAVAAGNAAACAAALTDRQSASNRARLTQTAVGFALQAARGDERGTVGRWLAGVSVDHARVGFRQSTASGTFDADRVAVPLAPSAPLTEITGTTSTWSAYVMRTAALAERVGLTTSLRANVTRVITEDRIDGALDGDHTFRSLNPAAGLTWAWTPTTTVFGGWSRGTRTPSPVELGCADPARPCLLPNAMQADPPLQQVRTDTFEVGLRARPSAALRWQATLFHATNRDDILFVSAPTASSHGYFRNVGATRRQGLELQASGRLGTLGWTAGYTLLDAVFRTSAELAVGDDDAQLVRPGDRLPGLSRHTLKLALDWQARTDLLLGAIFNANSGRVLRGNESGDAGDAGRVPGWTTVSVYGRWRVARNVEVFGRIVNLFDRRYAGGGVLAENAFPGGRFAGDATQWTREPFLAPGAPRLLQAGVRVEL